MAGISRDWLCKAHGVFESSESAPACPRGCNAVDPIFLRAPAVRTSGRTKHIDHTLESLAADFGLTDLSTRNGSVMNSIGAHSRPPQVAAAYQNLSGDPRMEALRPRFASPNEVLPMLNGTPHTAALSMKDQSGTGLGDMMHNSMGARNIDRAMTVIQAETSKEDNAKLQAALQGAKAA